MKRWTKYIALLLGIVLFAWGVKTTVDIRQDNRGLTLKIKELQKSVLAYEKENKELKERLKPKGLIYVGYDYKYRLLINETKMYQVPGKVYSEIKSIPANTAIEVRDVVVLNNEERWIYTVLPRPFCCEPENIKGWIKEAETSAITKENQKQIEVGVIVKKGTQVYNMMEYEQIETSKSEPLREDVVGCIMKRIGIYTKITAGFGWEFWVDNNLICYPPIE